jgi:ABC-2 type transport system ATP-binding protein
MAANRSGAPEATASGGSLPSRMAATPSTAGGRTALRVDGLDKRYGARQALRAVSFTAEAGELVAVVGPNGAGKTTLLSVLAGALRPDRGRVSPAPSEVGWVPQEAAVYGKLSVAENLRLFARLERAPGVDAAVERMLALTGLHDRRHDAVSGLSGGNRQRLNIAVGLLGEPLVLLLDEPSAALDPRQRAALWSFVGQLAAAGTTVLYTSHDVLEVERHADRVLVLADGDMLFHGTPAGLAQAGGGGQDFEASFLAFLVARGH